MKKLLFILSIISLFFSCAKKPSSYSDIFPPQEAPLHYSVFQDITNLMTPSPDSAFLLISAIFDTINQADLTTPDRHEYNILWAEALYKNDYLQSNDSAVNEAVKFYDSLVLLYPKNLDLQFQKARAYYYKGVGDNEKDDIVATCKDYLKALEVMENEFEKEKMNYEQNRFTGLIYTRLAMMYSNNDIIDAAMTYYRNSLHYFKKTDANYNISQVLKCIGFTYHLQHKIDSAICYYDSALSVLNENNSLLYREVMCKKAVVSFEQGEKKDSYKTLKDLIKKATSENEMMTYHSAIGNQYYNDCQYDSALLYLEYAFLSNNKYSKIMASQQLLNINHILGDKEKELYYARIYSSLTKKELDNTIRKDEMSSLFNDYEKNKTNNIYSLHKYRWMHSTLFIVVLIITSAILLFLFYKRKVGLYVKKISNKHRNEKRKDKSIIKETLKKLESSESKIKQHECNICFAERYEQLINSPICRKILQLVQNKSLMVKDMKENPSLVLSKKDHEELKNTINNIFTGYSNILKKDYPRITSSDMRFIDLVLLNLDKKQVGILLNVTYSAISQKYHKAQIIFETEADIYDFLVGYLKKIYG